jgi:hypothetical protein
MASSERINSIKPIAILQGDQMTANRQAAAMQTSPRKLAIATGVFFLNTHVTSIGAFPLYDPILNDANYILGSGQETQVLLGMRFEVILAIAIVGTALALYPVARRPNEGLAIGYAGLRALEAGVVALGVDMIDVVIASRSSAGLRAALVLGRSLREGVAIDDQKPCNRFSRASHDFLTCDGTRPSELLAIAHEQLKRYPSVALKSVTVGASPQSER